MTSKYPAMSMQFIYCYLIVQVTLIALSRYQEPLSSIASSLSPQSAIRFEEFAKPIWRFLHFASLQSSTSRKKLSCNCCFAVLPDWSPGLLFKVSFPRNKYSSTTNRLPETLAILLRILKSCLCVLLHINPSYVRTRAERCRYYYCNDIVKSYSIFAIETHRISLFYV